MKKAIQNPSASAGGRKPNLIDAGLNEDLAASARRLDQLAQKAREVSHAVPLNRPGTAGDGTGAEASPMRPFSQTDQDERDDTGRRVGHLSKAKVKEMEQADYDEDGGRPSQDGRDNENFQAETGTRDELMPPSGS